MGELVVVFFFFCIFLILKLSIVESGTKLFLMERKLYLPRLLRKNQEKWKRQVK
jgi:hypothetical protein